jgi:hypothetical protein
MQSNFKIILSVLFAIFISIIIFYFIMNWYPSNFDSTYIWSEYIKNKNEEPKIFLLGSSHTGVLNSTFIQNYITENDEHYKIYNLAINSDYPTRRAQTLGNLIDLNPKFVFYGIEIRMFEDQQSIKQGPVTRINDVLPNIQIIFHEIFFPLTEIDFLSKIPKSPKIVTLSTIKYFVKDGNYTVNLDVDSIRPLTKHNEYAEIISLEEIKEKVGEQKEFQGLKSENNREFDELKKNIEILKKNNIKVIVFATPKSSIYLDWLPNEAKEEFDQMLKELKNEYDIPVYSKYDIYANQNIWSNWDHVVETKQGLMYSKDMATIILDEIKK